MTENVDKSFDIMTFDYQEDDHENEKKNQMREASIREELGKISKRNHVGRNMNGLYTIIIYIDRKAENPEYILYVYGKRKKEVSALVDAEIKEFIREDYTFHYNRNQLKTEIPSIIRNCLNKGDAKEEFWCTYPRVSITMISNKIRYELFALEFNKKELDSYNVFCAKRHPFLENVKIEWEYRFGNKEEKTVHYNEMYRCASVRDVFLNRYESHLNTLSAMKYEGVINKGSILALKYQHKLTFAELKCNFEELLIFDEPIKLFNLNYKKIRKLLEITNGELSLLMNDCDEIFSIGKMVQKPSCEYYKVKFINFMEWSLSVNNNDYLSFLNLIPYLPSSDSDINEDDKILLKKTFAANNIDRIMEIIGCAIKQEHGTMVVITENAEEETQRMKDSGICVNKTYLSSQMIESVTSIDGAIICDPSGICYSIGVILDGKLSQKADSSRGARYNSAIRYIEQQKEKGKRTFIVIVSEDKYINCISTES